MGHVPDDPFWPPDPEDLEEVVVGELPFCLLQVHGPVPHPERDVPFTVEVHVGGGLTVEDVPYLLHVVREALAVEDMAIMPDGTLVRRVEAPVTPPDPPESPPTDRL